MRSLGEHRLLPFLGERVRGAPEDGRGPGGDAGHLQELPAGRLRERGHEALLDQPSVGPKPRGRQ